MESQTDLQFPVRERCLSVLENMKKHYSKSIKNRAVDKRSTYYLAPHGAKDPIARIITQIELDHILDWLADPMNLGTSISGFYLNNREKFPSLHQYPDKFLQDIQKWHDDDAHWTDKGISEEGYLALEAIRTKILRMQK